MGHFGKSFEDKEAAREIRKQNKLKKKGIEVNEPNGSAADERSMLKQDRKEKIGNFFNAVSNAREISFSNKMNRKLMKADTRNTVAQIEGYGNVANKKTSQAMDLQVMRDTDMAKVRVNVSNSTDNSQVDNSSTINNPSKPTPKAKVSSKKSNEPKPTLSNEPKPTFNEEPTPRKLGGLATEALSAVARETKKKL